VRAATADKSMLKIAVLLLSVRSSHSCVCGSENPICESESGGWCTEADGSLPGWGVCGGRFGTSCSRSYALCPDIASVTVAGVTYTEEPYGTYTPLTQNGCHSGPKEMPTFRNNEAASEYLYQCVTEGDDDYGYWLTSMFYDGTSCTGGTRVTNFMNMASCPTAGSPSCIFSTTGGTSNLGCSGVNLGASHDHYSLTGSNVNGRDIYQQDGYTNEFLWMCSSGHWVHGVNMNPQRYGCASSTVDVPLYSLCPYAGSIVGAPPSPPIGVGTAASPPSPLPPPPPSAIMCTAYVPGTATGGSCSYRSINGLMSCTPTGCRSGCPGYRPGGYEQVHCSPPPPPSSSPPPPSSSPQPPSSSPQPPTPITGATQSPGPHCTCDQVNTFLQGYATTHYDGCKAAVANCAKNAYSVPTDFKSWTCGYDSTRNPQYVWSCTDAPASSSAAGGDPSPASSTSGNACGDHTLGITDSCCDDGPPDDSHYACPVATQCGKGQCIHTGSMLCIDGHDSATDYVCPAGTSCGRGVCVPAGATLCGTSGTKTCPASTRCCGRTAATKNTDMTCNNIFPLSDQCPIDRLSSTVYIAMPYIYIPSVASMAGSFGLGGSSPIGPIIGGVAGVVVLCVIAACALKKYRMYKASNAMPITSMCAIQCSSTAPNSHGSMGSNIGIGGAISCDN